MNDTSDRMGPSHLGRVSIVLVLLAAACAPSKTGQTPASGGASQSQVAARPGPNRVTVAIGAELDSLATKLEAGNTFASEFHWLLNSPLTSRDPEGIARPLLADGQPSRDSGSWLVNPDGTMRTTWKIKPNARWHDGRPVTSRDMAFAFRVYSDEAMAVRDREPERFIDHVELADEKTFVLYWKQPYPWASELGARQLEALPEHIMGKVYEAGDADAFITNPFWASADYVGDGPYRLVQWDQGAQMIFRAFDDYFMGRPRLDEVVFKVIGDTNTVVANVLSGAVDVTVGVTLGQQAGATVRNEWTSGEGQVVISPVRWRYTQIQLDPARTQQPALLDPRVRRALVLGLDRATMAGIVTEGTSSVAEVPVSPTDPVFQRVQQAITSHPYDTSRAAALLQEAGWSRSATGSVVNAAGQPFALDIRTTAGTDNETEMSIMAADLAGLGLQVGQTVVPQSRIRDNEYRVTFPGLNTTAQSINIPGTMAVAEGGQCATAERRFAGSNRGCWINTEYDRLFVVANSSLDPSERANAVVGALKILTDDTGVFGLAYNSENVAVRKGLIGPGARWPAQIGNTWNIQDWHWE